MGSATVQGRLWSQKARAWSELQEKMHQSLYVPLVRVIEVAGEEEVRGVVEDVFRSAVRADGSVRHENVFRWVIAEPA